MEQELTTAVTKSNTKFTSPQHMHDLIKTQREYFNTGITKDLNFRINQLRKLKKAIVKHQKNLEAALKADLNKPEMEAYATEIGVTVAEIDFNLNHFQDNMQVLDIFLW